MRFEKLGSFNVPTEGLDRFVDRKSGNVGRDLEQNAARFAEVDRAEVVAVLLFGRVLAVGADQLLAPSRACCASSAARKAM